MSLSLLLALFLSSLFLFMFLLFLFLLLLLLLYRIYLEYIWKRGGVKKKFAPLVFQMYYEFLIFQMYFYFLMHFFFQLYFSHEYNLESVSFETSQSFLSNCTDAHHFLLKKYQSNFFFASSMCGCNNHTSHIFFAKSLCSFN